MDVKVMSFNIRNMRSRDGANGWEHRREAVCDLVRRHNPDILGIQEAYAEQVAEMRRALPKYTVIGVGRDDGRREGEQCALFVRTDAWQVARSGTFWFSDTPAAPGSRHWTPQHARIGTWAVLIGESGPPLIALNVHLDHESQIAREKSAQLISEFLRREEPGIPAIVLGDFNMELTNPAMRMLLAISEPCLLDTYPASRQLEPHGTFHGFSGDRTREKIDYILVSAPLRALTSEIVVDSVGGAYPSDHFPLTARIRLEA